MTDRHPTSRPPLVLIANDQEWSARSLESILAPNGYAVLRAYTGRQALERARSAQPDIVILDAQMPDLHGIDVCRILRNDPNFSASTPIIITTAGPSGRPQRLEAYRCGAWEFLGQPLDGEALLLKLHTFLQCKLEVDRLREESLLDHATGLYNMRGLARRAREIGSEAQRLRQPLSCVVFSPDPEQHGEGETAAPEAQGAEELFSRIAERVGEVVRRTGRSSDAIGRLGQTEFGVIAPGTPADGAVRLVERLGASLEASPIPLANGERRVKLRAGYCAVADFAESPVDAVEMLLRATSALRDLRSEGDGDRVRAFDQTPVKPLG